MKNFIHILSAFILATVLSAGFSQKSDFANQNIPINPKVKIGKLENGLVYYIQKNAKPENRVELRLVVKVGSMQEDDNQVGLAHFTEHMAFNGSKHFEKNKLVSYMQSIGMRFGGDINAYTSFDETVYMLTVPTDNQNQLDSGFLVIQDWAANLSMEGKEIDAERGVIIEEWRVGKNADERMRKTWFPVVFTNSRYADRLPIGTYENLKSFKHETLRKFYRDWYRPNLQAVVIVGDIDVNYAEAKIKELFSPLQNPENAPEKIIYPIGEHKDVLITRATDKEATHSQILTLRKFKKFQAKNLEDYRIIIMQNLYNMMINERFDELQQNPESPAIQTGSYYSSFIGNVDALTGYALAKENKMEETLLLLLTEEERVKQFGFLESEFERAKEELLANLKKAANEENKTLSSALASSYVKHFLNETPIMGAKTRYIQTKKLLETIKVSEINDLLKKWIINDNFVIVITGPEKEGLHILNEQEVKDLLKHETYKKVSAYVDDFEEKPLIEKELTGSKVVASKELKEVKATEYTLANGIKVIIKQTQLKDDEILMEAREPGGSSLFSLYDFPSTLFATNLVERSGLGEFDYISLNKALKGKKISISPYIHEISNGFYGSSTVNDFETMLQLLYLYYDAPRFDESAFKAIVSEMKNQLKFITSNPTFVFLDTLVKTITQNDPRKPAIPDETLLNNASYRQAIEVYKARFSNASNLIFTFVGNIDPDTSLPLIEKYIGSLPTSEGKDLFKNVYYGFPDEDKHVDIYVGIDNKSTIGIVFNSEYEWNIKNNVCLDLFHEVLEIRMIEIIREKMGGAYSPAIQFNRSKYPETVFTSLIYLNCDPKKVKKINKTILSIHSKLLEKGFTDEELHKAKEQIKKSLEVNIEKNSYWRNYISDKYFYSDPLSDQETYLETLNSLTSKEITNTIKPFFDKKHAVYVYQYPEKKGKKKKIKTSIKTEENKDELLEEESDNSVKTKKGKKKKKKKYK